jgi:protein-L-isoaspartate(D-aspartate) O-methyltransferase
MRHGAHSRCSATTLNVVAHAGEVDTVAMAPDAPDPLVAAARAAGVRDRRVLEALAAVPRARYVLPGDHGKVDRDIPLPIGGDQVTTQPSLLATMVAALALEGHERVLEVGTGLGYQAAVLGRLAREVWSIERRVELAAAATANLAAAGVGNVRVVVGDGSEGLAAHAPYEAIVVAAAYPRVPPPLAAQLAPGGRLVQPIGPGGAEEVTQFRRAPGEQLIRVRVIASARFVALYGRHGFASCASDGK